MTCGGMRVVFLSHTFLGSVFVVGSHRLAHAMRSLGNKVLHISTPISPLHHLRVRAQEANRLQLAHRGLHLDKTGVYNLVPKFRLPVGLLPLPRIAWDLSVATAPDSFSDQLLQSGFVDPDVVLIDQPLLIGFKRVLRGRCWIYRPTDMYSLMRWRYGLRNAERLCLRMSQAVVATSGPVMDHIRGFAEFHHPSMIVENGVDLEPYTRTYPRPSDLPNGPGPRLVYVGAFDRRLDCNAFTYLSRRLPNCQIILIGPMSEAIRRLFLQHHNIFALGPKNSSDIPAYLSHCDIGLLPLSADPANAGRSPMKLYEYLAAGLHAICRHTPELARRIGFAPKITLYENYGELEATIVKALDEERGPPFLDESRSWASIATTLLRFAESCCRRQV
jgi:hypothetical protein